MASTEAFTGIRAFLGQCQHSPTICSEVQNQETCTKVGNEWQDLPSRVIDTTADPLKIVEYSTMISSKPYAAFSYVWGGDQSYCLTVETLEHKTASLDLDRIPHSIHDAIRATRNLGIEYLWVDAM